MKASIAKANAWARFEGQFPNADRKKFVAQVEVDEKNVSAEIFFKDSPTSLRSVFGSYRKRKQRCQYQP